MNALLFPGDQGITIAYDAVLFRYESCEDDMSDEGLDKGGDRPTYLAQIPSLLPYHMADTTTTITAQIDGKT